MLVTVLTLTYVGFMFVIVQLMMKQRLARIGEEPFPQRLVPLVFVALFLSALTTESIGLHAIFGAFLIGAVMPHDSALTRAFTGMRTQIGLVTGVEQWFICAMIIVVATLGKFGASLAACTVDRA